MTGSIAYRKKVVDSAGGFDENYAYHTDRKLGLEIQTSGGKICFNPEMVVYHPQVTFTIMGFLRDAQRIKARVRLFKEFRDRKNIVWRIVSPRNLAVLLFPPLVLLSPFLHKYRKWEDFRLLPFIYVRAVYERWCLWKECIKERVFLI
jgi:GT2 family glycosyltransferase